MGMVSEFYVGLLEDFVVGCDMVDGFGIGFNGSGVFEEVSWWEVGEVVGYWFRGSWVKDVVEDVFEVVGGVWYCEWWWGLMVMVDGN